MSDEYLRSWATMDEAESRGLDIEWVSAVAGAIERMVAAGMADQQIWDALYLDSIVSEDLEASRAHELYVQTHLRLIHGSPERHLSVMKRPVGRTRARLLTDVREAMHHAIADIGQTKLTWTNVAMKISMLYPAIGSLDESTLRRWAKAEKLPPPWDPSWRTR